jgi:hypothetical protein
MYLKMHWNAIAPTIEFVFMGPVFINIDGSLVGRDQFVRMLEKSLSHIGLSGGCYKSHSFRIGSCCHAKLITQPCLSTTTSVYCKQWPSLLATSDVISPTLRNALKATKCIALYRAL